MKTAIVVAMKEEYDNYDLLTGVGPDYVKNSFPDFIKENNDLELVINFGTCGSFKKEYHGMYSISSFSNTLNSKRLGDDRGLHLVSHYEFLTDAQGFSNADLVDCEAFWLKELCDQNNLQFQCFKYVTDYVGENCIDDFRKHVEDGKESFDLIYRKIYENS